MSDVCLFFPAQTVFIYQIPCLLTTSEPGALDCNENFAELACFRPYSCAIVSSKITGKTFSLRLALHLILDLLKVVDSKIYIRLLMVTFLQYFIT